MNPIFKEALTEASIALETLYASDLIEPIGEIGPDLRKQIETAVLALRKAAHKISAEKL